MAERYRHTRRPLQAGARPPRGENVRGRGPERMRGSEGGPSGPLWLPGGRGGEARRGPAAGHALCRARGAPSSPASGRLVPAPTLASVRRLRPQRREARATATRPASVARACGVSGGTRPEQGAAGMASIYITLCLHSAPVREALGSATSCPRVLCPTPVPETLEERCAPTGSRRGPRASALARPPPGPRSREAA